jgi:hypothetical protein
MARVVVLSAPAADGAVRGTVAWSAGAALRLLVFTSNLIPVGTIFNIPFRVPLFLITALLTAQLVLVAPAARVRGPVLYGVALVGFILLEAWRGLIGTPLPDAFVLDDTRTYLATFTIPVLAAILWRLDVVTAPQLARAFVQGSILYSIVKMILFGFLLSLPDYATIALDSLTANNIGGGASIIGNGVSRIQTGLDFAVLLSCVLLLRSRVALVPASLRWPAILLLSAAVLITFSRALVALFVLMLFAELIFHARGNAFRYGVAALVAITVSAAPDVGDLVQRRLETGRQGDNTRVPQAKALLDLWERHPLLGEGLGSYTNVVIRDTKAPYFYELQLHSILTKIGVIGMLVLMGFALIAFAASPLLPLSGQGWQAAVFLAILLSGATNPYLFSSAAANVYIALFVAIGVLGGPGRVDERRRQIIR